jgi:hypothetical protein
MMELRIFSTLKTFSDVSMYRLRKFSAPSFSDSDIWVENFLKNTQKIYDIGARDYLIVLLSFWESSTHFTRDNVIADEGMQILT